MKKRVRIYKPVNKYQEGGMQVEAQAEAPAQPQYTDEQLVSAMMQMMGDESNPLSLDEAQATIAEQAGDQRAMILRNQVENWIQEQQIMDRANISNDDEAGEDMYLTDQADNLAADEEAAAEAEHDARMQQMYYDDSSSQDYSDDDEFAAELVARQGGYMPQSRYGSNVSRLLRRQDGGGDQPQPQEPPQQKYAADTTGKDLRVKQDPNTYAKLLQNHANQALIKTDLQALAKAAKQQQLGQFTGMDPNAPVEDSDFDMPEAQFGGAGRERRMERRMNRRVNKMVGQIPMGMYDKRSSAFPSQFNIVTLPQGMPGMNQNIMPARGSVNDGIKLANIDVRRTGLFGRPKEYTINFVQEAYTNPQIRQDVIKQEQNNKVEEIKDKAAEDKAKDQSTESSNNAEVNAAETPTTANEEADVKVEDIQVVSGRNARTNTAAANTSDVAVNEEGETQAVEDARTQNEQPVDPANIQVDYARNFPGAMPITRENLDSRFPSDREQVNQYLDDINSGPHPDKRLHAFDPSRDYSESYFYDDKGQRRHGAVAPLSEEEMSGKNSWKSNGYEYLMKDGKLYKGKYEPGSGAKHPTNWTEITDPQRIRTVTAAMSDAGYKPEAGKKPIKFKTTGSEVFTSKNYGDAGYVFRNGKLYKAPKYGSQGAANEQWYEVTEPTRIEAVKKSMQKKGMKVPGASSKSPSTNPLDIVKGVTDSPAWQIGSMIFDEGGFTDSSNPDLYRFVYGGDDPAIPMLENDPYEYQSKNVNDPYFAYGGLTAYQDKGETEEGAVDEGVVDEGVVDEGTTEDVTSTDEGAAATTTEVSNNQKKYNALKELGVNVGNYQEGIDYTKLNAQGKGRQTEGAKTQQYPGMYPPVFNKRMPGTNIFGGPKGIQYAGSWMKQKGLPYDPVTGQVVNAYGNPQLQSIKVDKVGLLGRPKKYTMNFMGDAPAAGQTTMYRGSDGQLHSVGNNPAAPAAAASAKDAQKLARKNKFANALLRTPGLRKIGARMYEEDPNATLPEGTQYTTEQNPSLPLRSLQSNLGQENLVADQYNRMNEPKLDIEGLPDSPIPEITPEEFSFNDLQRFTGVQGPQEQPEYPYVNEYGFPVSQPEMRDISGNTIQEGQGIPMNIAGPMSDMANLPDEQGYFNDLQLEQNQEQRIANMLPESASNDYYQDVMQPNRDKSEYDFMTGQMLTPEERALQRQENLEGLDPMRLPDESRSMPEPWITQNMVNAQQAQIRAEQQRRMQEQQRIRAQREAQQRAEIQSQESNAGKTQKQTNQTNQTEQANQTQQVKPIKVNSKGVENYGTNLNYDNIQDIERKLRKQGWNWDEVSAGFDSVTGVWDPAKAEKYRKEARVVMDKAIKQDEYNRSPEGIAKNKKEQRKLETKEIKSYGVPEYANYQTKNDLFKAMQAGHVKTPSQKGATGNELRRLGSEYESWLLTQDPTSLNGPDDGLIDVNGKTYPTINYNGKNYYVKDGAYYPVESIKRRDGGQALQKAQPGGQQCPPGYTKNSMGVCVNMFTKEPLFDAGEIQAPNATLKNPWAGDGVNNATGERSAFDPSGQSLIDEALGKNKGPEANKQMFSVDAKRKDMYNVDFPVVWGQAKGIAGMAGNIFNEATAGRENTRNMLQNTYAETTEPTNQRLDLGNFVKQSGFYKPNQTGFDFNIQDRTSAKKGGSMKNGNVTYMSAAQVKKFLADGGELEFI